MSATSERFEPVDLELSEGHSGFELAADGSTAGLYIYQDGRYTYVNPAFAQIFGQDRQRIVDQLLPEDLAHPDDRAKLREFIRRQLEGEAPSVRFLYRGLRADGSTVICEESGKSVELNGRPAIVGTVLDVSDREAAQDSLIESEALFRGVAEKSPNMVLILQAGRIVYANPASETVLGYRRSELLSAEFDYLAVCTAESAAGLRQRLTQQLEGVEVEPYEFQVVRRDGQLADLLQTSRLINHQGRVAILLMVSDITLRKQAEQEREELLRAEKKQRQLAETLARVGLSLSANLELRNLMDLICRQSIQLFGVGAAYVWMVEGNEIVGFAGQGGNLDAFLGLRKSLADPGTLGARVVRERRPVYVNRAQRSKWVNPDLIREFQTQAILGMPLLMGDRAVGALMLLEIEDPNRFTARDVELAGVFGSHLAVAVENARLIEETQRRLKWETLLKEAIGVFTSTLEVKVVLGRLAEKLCQAVDGTSAYICQYDRESKSAKVLAEYYSDDASSDERKTDLGASYSLAEAFPGTLLAMEAGRAMVRQVSDPALDEVERKHLLQFGAKATLAIPVNVGGQLIAYAAIWESRRERSFAAEEIELCQAIAQQAAIAIESGRLYERAQQEIADRERAQEALSVAMARLENGLQRTRDLVESEQALRDTTAAVSGTLNLDEVLDQILENVGRVVGHDAADIMLLVDTEFGKRELRVVRGRGYAERGLAEWLNDLRLPWEEMQNLRMMEASGKPTAVPDTQDFPGWFELPETRWIRSYAGAPLRRKGKTFGFLNLSSEHPGTYQQAHAERLQAFADQAAIAIENARLYAHAEDEIARRKQAEAAERGFAKMKEEFVLSASHSLRTPIHTLRGYLELLGSGKVREPEREAEFLANALENAQRIDQIVHELLDVTQMESEAGRLRMESVPIGELVASSLESLTALAEERQVRLVFEKARPHLRVSADRRRLVKALAEIVENAIKFSPEGGLVTVRVLEDNGRVCVRISDQGPGISKAELVSLFGNSGAGGRAEIPSPGLGLFLAHAVIDAHQGQIRVESEVGEGTTFEVAIPSRP